MIANITYAIEVLGAQHIALISDNGGMSQAAAAEIAAYMTDLGHPLVTVQEFAFRAEDMTPQLFSMRQAGADAVLLINSLVDDTRKLLQNREEIGWDVPVLASLTTTNYAVGIARDIGVEAFEGVVWCAVQRHYSLPWRRDRFQRLCPVCGARDGGLSGHRLGRRPVGHRAVLFNR